MNKDNVLLSKSPDRWQGKKRQHNYSAVRARQSPQKQRRQFLSEECSHNIRAIRAPSSSKKTPQPAMLGRSLHPCEALWGNHQVVFQGYHHPLSLGAWDGLLHTVYCLFHSRDNFLLILDIPFCILNSFSGMYVTLNISFLCGFDILFPYSGAVITFLPRNNPESTM